MQTTISLDIKDKVGYLTFACTQPDKPATLDYQVLHQLETQLNTVYAQVNNLRALVVQSLSDKYFVVGANVNALQTLNPESIVPWVQQGHKVFNQLEKLPLPVIAKVEGYALGGGLELALACDIIAASRGAQFGQPEARLGLVTGWGGSYRLPKRVGIAQAKELFFTGKIINAETALAIGLVNFVGETIEFENYLETLLHDIEVCSPVAVSWLKQLVEASAEMSLEDNCLREAAASSACLANADTQTRIAAFLTERKKKSGQ